MFTLIAIDKANHELYGARIASVAASVVLLVCLVVVPALLDAQTIALARLVALLAAAVAAQSAAAVAGGLKERMDGDANEAAAAAGQPPVHDVSSADMKATAMGGAVVAGPLLIAWLLLIGIHL